MEVFKKCVYCLLIQHSIMQIIGGAQVALETGPQLLQCWAILAWHWTGDARYCLHSFTQDLCWPCYWAAWAMFGTVLITALLISCLQYWNWNVFIFAGKDHLFFLKLYFMCGLFSFIFALLLQTLFYSALRVSIFNCTHIKRSTASFSAPTISFNFIAVLEILAQYRCSRFFLLQYILVFYPYWKGSVCIVITFSPFRLEVIETPYNFHMLFV